MTIIVAGKLAAEEHTNALHSTSSLKTARMTTTYRLKYWPTIPGRGEYIRLAFRAAHTAFEDDDEVGQLKSYITPQAGHFAPPVLEVVQNGKKFTLSQTPAILAYLAPRLGLAGDGSEEDRATVVSTPAWMY